jgi:hypothetical protein
MGHRAHLRDFGGRRRAIELVHGGDAESRG